jgi:hypothetical protein
MGAHLPLNFEWLVQQVRPRFLLTQPLNPPTKAKARALDARPLTLNEVAPISYLIALLWTGNLF